MERVYVFGSGTGAGMDIVVSSVKAYVGALNKMLDFKEKSPKKVPSRNTKVTAWMKIFLWETKVSFLSRYIVFGNNWSSKFACRLFQRFLSKEFVFYKSLFRVIMLLTLAKGITSKTYLINNGYIIWRNIIWDLTCLLKKTVSHQN